jgi:hypothetical protein
MTIILILMVIIGLPALVINLKIVRAEPTFNDNFDDGVADGWTQQVGSWSVTNGEYFVSVGVVENGISTVNGLNLKDCVIETKMKFTDTVGFRAGIVFRYTDNEHYYSFELSNEYNSLIIVKYSPQDPGYGTGVAGLVPESIENGTEGAFPIQRNVDYTLRVVVQGNVFRGYVNGQEVVSGSDDSYSNGLVGLRARRADVNFDYFVVENGINLPLPSPTPTPSPVPMPNQSLPSYSDDFNSDSGAWGYLGSAYRDQTNQYLVLTESGFGASGVAFFKTPIRGSFTANFRYKAGGGNHGDGFTMFFYKQKYSSLDNGGSQGFSVREGSILKAVPGYGIEFDGWQNIPSDFQQFKESQQNPQGDPSANHIALIKDFSGNHLAYVDDLRVTDNNWHQATVEVQASSVSVFVDQGLLLQWSGTLDRTYDGFGFSGATGGGGSNWHIIDDFLITAHNLKKSALNISVKSSTSYPSFSVQIDGYLTLNGTGISDAPILLSYSVTGGKSWMDLTLIYTGSDGSYSATWLPSVTGNYLVKAIYEGDADTLGASSEIVNFAVMQLAENNLLSVSSNSTVTSLAFNSTTSELRFTVNGPSETTGYVKITIAKSLVTNAVNIKVYLDGNPLNYEVISNSNAWLLTFTYGHSSHQIRISLAASAATMTFLGIVLWIVIVSTPFVVVISICLLFYLKKRKH